MSCVSAPADDPSVPTPAPAPVPARGARRWAFLGIGGLSLALGVTGLVLPLLPTVPFLLLAVWCFARSSARLERWILEHPRLGPPVRRWREHGVVSLRAKWFANLWLTLSSVLALRSGGPTLGIAAAIVCAAVLLFLWTRPSRAPRDQVQPT
jgi:uncharacterized protein